MSAVDVQTAVSLFQLHCQLVNEVIEEDWREGAALAYPLHHPHTSGGAVPDAHTRSNRTVELAKDPPWLALHLAIP